MNWSAQRMLEEISIENLGVIGKTQVELGPGLTVITGETGAGKTMLLTGLNLLMGGKTDSSMVRTGSKSSYVEGRVGEITPEVKEQIDLAGGVLDDDETLLIARSIAAAGRSRTFLGGRAVPQQVLSEIARELVTIHGQSEQIRLKTSTKQREALDEFAGDACEKLLAEYRKTWTERATTATHLQTIIEKQQERAHEAELLRIGLTEIERVDPQPAEDVALAAEALRLSNSQELKLSAYEAYGALKGGDILDNSNESANVAELLDQAKRALLSVAHNDPELAKLAGRIDESVFMLEDVAADLSSYLSSLESDPGRLEFVEQRRSELSGLTRTYGETIDEVLKWSSVSGLRLLELEDDSERIVSLQAEVTVLDAKLIELAKKLTKERTRAAKNLGTEVSQELKGLAMGGAAFSVEIEKLDEPGPHGQDAITMLLSAHRGAPARPLGKGASGGELSRVMLALEVALATASSSGSRGVPTMIFDEVDAGVGGQAAIEIGRRLAQLAQTFQVIVVTHLAQVAAFAHTQLVVVKGTHGSNQNASEIVTQSDIRKVSGDERVQELARMLSGQQDSQTAQQHALELLELATVRL
ncbi:DNA repair protein RecN [Jonesiaceae bacterium BS-20]|uniref:DNA repair protein RecN n=1 Tax=Jonesiaceae bacterium BS-20 TaxID=3120821 RepID=A0AAU7DZ39_9MICO